MYTLSGAPSINVTICGVSRAGPSVNSAGYNPTFFTLGNNNDNLMVFVNGSTGAVTGQKTVGGVAVTAISSVTVVPGDQIAWVLRYDGSNLKLTVSKNAAAAVTTTTATTTSPGAMGTAQVGFSSLTNASANTASEQLIVFNRALSDADATAWVGQVQETDFNDAFFTGIILEIAGDTVRGTSQALSLSGTGNTRAGAAIPCYVEQITTGDPYNPDDDLALTKVTVASPSGIGEGQLVAFQAVGGLQYTVKRVSAGTGLYDELYVA
jgi:hypothetical protein